jgi:hypothetical protein
MITQTSTLEQQRTAIISEDAKGLFGATTDRETPAGFIEPAGYTDSISRLMTATWGS